MKSIGLSMIGMIIATPLACMGATATFSGTNYVEDLSLVTNGGDMGNYNGGSNVVLSSGAYNDLGASDSATLIRFTNLSSLAGKTVTSATITLTLATDISSATTLSLFKVAAANAGWVEGTNSSYAWPAVNSEFGTWNYKNFTGTGSSAGTDWAGAAGCSLAGTDYDATALVSITLPVGTPGMASGGFDISAALVQSWIDGSAANAGLVLRNMSGTQALFYSSELAAGQFGPVLTVEYADTPVPEAMTLSLLLAGSAGLLMRRK